MEEEGSQPTQATQRALDPRRVGKQNSGLSDEVIADIICVLHPSSPSACREVARIARANGAHVVSMDGDGGGGAMEPDYQIEDDAERFELAADISNHAIVLRLSSRAKNPLQGYQFGRNATKCDIYLAEDPRKRLSNVHFRIYINDHGVIMLEDQSTNGTFVDNTLLRAKNVDDAHPRRRTLSQGSRIKILMHDEAEDIRFMVRVPYRTGHYHQAYNTNLAAYLERMRALASTDADQTMRAGPDGHPDLFSTPRPRVPPPRPQPRVPLPTSAMESVDRFPHEWRGSDKYNKICQIGKGAFAVVYKVTSKYDGQPYAAKELEKRRFVKNGVLDQKVDMEMKIMQRVNHPNIVRFIDHFDWENRLLIIIMEYVEGGDLGRLVQDHGRLPEAAVRAMGTQLLSALGYLHENNITHRDVKPDNILISSTDPFEVKLTDFGLSKMVDNEETFLRTFCGTLLYCAPEVYSEFNEYDEQGYRQPRNKAKRQPYGRYDHAVDIWSLGGVLFYALTAKPPFPVKNGVSYSELLHQIMTTDLGLQPLVNAGVSPDAVGFLRSMLNRRPEQRATVQDLMGHPWMTREGDEELNVVASQLSLRDADGDRHMPHFEEVTDDVLADFDSGDSQTDVDPDATFGRPQPRLFGEVGVSAVGSSGVIAENHMNVSMLDDASHRTSGQTEEVVDSLETGDGSSRPSNSNGNGSVVDLFASVAEGQSLDQLPSLVHNVASQSLGTTESVVYLKPDPEADHEALHPRARSAGEEVGQGGGSFTLSKRRLAPDTSDEFSTPEKQKPLFKRLRSEGNMESFAADTLEETLLLASIPVVKRTESGRQMLGLHNKMGFWQTENIDTWHLRYPEMSNLQLEAFRLAAKSRKEEFAPGKSPLWDLAMKYFPFSQEAAAHSVPDTANPIARLASPDTAGRGLHRDTGTLDEMATDFLPSTAVVPTQQDEEETAPFTAAPEQPQTPPDMAALLNAEETRPFAVLESTPDSSLSGISIPIRDTLVSWGRHNSNTAIHPTKTDTKVPKYGLRVLLWREGYDPSRRLTNRLGRPWERERQGQGPDDAASEYMFYLSTRATAGVHVNGLLLPTSKAPGPKGAGESPPHWMRLHDGDEIVVWGQVGSPDKLKLRFCCGWGGSSVPRPAGAPQVHVPVKQALRIEQAWVRTEKRAKGDADMRTQKMAANADVKARSAAGPLEERRAREAAFERMVAEAKAYVAKLRVEEGSP